MVGEEYTYVGGDGWVNGVSDNLSSDEQRLFHGAVFVERVSHNQERCSLCDKGVRLVSHREVVQCFYHLSLVTLELVGGGTKCIIHSYFLRCGVSSEARHISLFSIPSFFRSFMATAYACLLTRGKFVK